MVKLAGRCGCFCVLIAVLEGMAIWGIFIRFWGWVADGQLGPAGRDFDDPGGSTPAAVASRGRVRFAWVLSILGLILAYLGALALAGAATTPRREL